MGRTHVDAHMGREISIAYHFQLRFCSVHNHLRPPWRKRVLQRLRRRRSHFRSGTGRARVLPTVTAIDYRPFFAVNSVRGLQIPAVVATENAPFTQPALVEASRRGGGIGKAQSTERTRQRRTVDLLCTSCPDIMATLSATADDTDNLTFETARECAIPPFISPIAQRPSLDGAEKPIMRKAPLMEGTFIKFSNFR